MAEIHGHYSRAEPTKAGGDRLFQRPSPKVSVAVRARRVARFVAKSLRRLRPARRRRVVLSLACLLVLSYLLVRSRGGSASASPSMSVLVDPLGDLAGSAGGRAAAAEAATRSQEQPSPAMLEARGRHGSQPMSMIVLFHNEYDSLLPVLDSWINGGLTDYVEEIVFFLNGVASDATFRSKVTALRDRIPAGKVRVVAQEPNLPLGLAIKRMVELASNEYVLLMEKDWELVEPREVMVSRLRDSKILVGSGRAQLVRHRHRDNPGVPIHALIMHAGREESIMRQQPNLLCFAHHWQRDPSAQYPGAGIMRRCGGRANLVDEEDVYCTPARYCQWTNNPGVFLKRWFIDELGARFAAEYERELAKEGPKSPFLDFEYYTNWRDWAWNSLNVTVATGAGLFAHKETEHRHFNTFWYAFYRLTTDLEDIRLGYLRNEAKFKALGGVHVDPSAPPPPSLLERYPVDFVRKYQVPHAFTGNVSSQAAMIAAVYDPYVDKYRVTHDPGADSAASPKASLSVPWRQVITDLHFAAERAMMLAVPTQPHEMTITLVSCLIDLDRHTVDRSFDQYMDAMRDWLTHEYPKVVYTTADVAEQLRPTMSEEAKRTTKFMYTSRGELRTKWMGPDNYDKVQEIRNSSAWREQAPWLTGSPQAKLADYNPLVMSKMFMMREAARLNPWATTHLLFVDAKHNCRNPKLVTPRSDHIIRAHMFNKLLLTYFDYTPGTEVHGFAHAAFNSWLNINSRERQVVKVGRGGIIGGSPFVIEALTAMYDVALTATLREGLMGTEENILSILMAQVPQYVDPFSNDWWCKTNLAGDHKCRERNTGYNCGIFIWAADGAPAPGSASAAVAPPSEPAKRNITIDV
jgi:hypothetical protein